MGYGTILVAKEGGVATITLNRPDKMNAYNQQMVEELVDALEDVSRDDAVRVLVLTGAGRAFCSGFDISGQGHEERGPLVTMEGFRRGFHRLVKAMRALDKPAIAAINGPAVAGGLTLALLCDLRIASDKARLGDTSLRFGFFPDDGGPYFLPRLVGLEKALELTLLSDVLDAQEAQRIGLVGRVVPHDRLAEAVAEVASRLAQGPPVAQRLAKRAIYKQLEMDLDSSLEDCAAAGYMVSQTEDVQEGRRAFQEKRAPRYKGR